MLEPNSRRLLLESLRPPEGHRLDFALATTYSLDLTALLTAPVAFAFSDFQEREGRPMLEPLALLKAVRQYADRVCLFHQAGKIHVPRAYQPLLASLEGSVVEATAPRGGNFHPKLWLLRYTHAEDEAVTYRLLCASRNMTFDRSWDTLLCLEGPLRERANAFTRNHPLGRFVEELPAAAVRGVTAEWRSRIGQMAYELRRVEFEVPEPFEELDFHPIGVGDDGRWPFPERMDRLLVVSPFVDDGLPEDLAADWGIPMQLVSRPESLARLKPETLELFEQLWVLDDTAEPEPGDAEEDATGPPDSATTENSPGDGAAGSAAVGGNAAGDGIPLVGLHAKLYVADAGWQTHVWTGSANATRAGFERNVEFLIELRGKRGRCGVETLMGRSAEGGPKRVACLADLLQPYVPTGGEPTGKSEAEAFERHVDALAKQLAAAAPVAACEPLDGPETYALAVQPTRNVTITTRGTLRARPISLKPFDAQDVNPAAAEWARFAPVSLLGLTSFFAFEVTSPDGRLARQFVLNVPLENAPDGRQQHILRHLLSDRERVLRFLLLLLADSDAHDFAAWIGDAAASDGKPSFIHSLFDATLFESLMRALDRDPARLDQVAGIITDLRQSSEGQELLPEDFEAVWGPVWEVRRRQLESEPLKSGGKSAAIRTLSGTLRPGRPHAESNRRSRPPP